jgi:hypothetical protein
MTELAIDQLLEAEAEAVATYRDTMAELWNQFSLLLCAAMAERSN